MDAHPFVDVLISDEILNGDASPVVFELISIAVSQGKPLKKKKTLRYPFWIALFHLLMYH